ncbi:hypothetical protein [Azorhizobium sp. AG788]|uniref:hypothetical protein n=1 Tax=Azorhizobium sp. AG788 TaxID=2183897 RepID=UPI003138694C
MSGPLSSMPVHGRHEPLSEALATPGGEVVLTLNHSVALVVFDLLARMVDHQDAEGVRELLDHPGEVAALWSLMAAFEQVLNEPLEADYRQLIMSARDDVVARLGAGA